MPTSFSKQREAMLVNQLQARDITDQRVLEAFRQVPREKFVDPQLRYRAYIDKPLPIKQEQSISQPYIVAKMCQLAQLTGTETVLDIGTGSGYQAAILSLLVKQVFTIEIIEDLATEAKIKLKKLGYTNVEVIHGDGQQGLEKHAPYDLIKSAAATKEKPQAWKDQLQTGGKIILPLITQRGQELVKITKEKSSFKQENFGLVAFVPLI
jgi:protein-L-isoaspartate(D-aspartate) O-methyltransferase